MVIPFAAQTAIRALGLDDLRAALKFFQALTTDTPGGLGLSRREVGRRLGIAESTLRGIEREGSNPRQASRDKANKAIAESDMFIDRKTTARTTIETFRQTDVPLEFYRPLIPDGTRAFRLVVKTPDGHPYPYATLTPRAIGTFDVKSEIQRMRDEGRVVARVVYDRGP